MYVGHSVNSAFLAQLLPTIMVHGEDKGVVDGNHVFTYHHEGKDSKLTMVPPVCEGDFELWILELWAPDAIKSTFYFRVKGGDIHELEGGKLV